MKITLNDINILRNKKNLDRILWVDYKEMTAKQKSKLISEVK